MRSLIILLTLLILAYANITVAVECPATITCNYEQGVCDKINGLGLDYSAANEPFVGSQVMNLSKITAYMQGSLPYGAYQFRCSYYYGHSVISFYTEGVKKLIGSNWVFSGFGKNMAACSSITDPAACAGA